MSTLASTPSANDTKVLRDLARRYADIAADPVQDARRDLWRRKNSLESCRPLIYVRALAWGEMPEAAFAECEFPLFQQWENWFRRMRFHASMDDDTVFEPWLTIGAAHRCAGWGAHGDARRGGPGPGSYKIDYPIRTLDDIDKLRFPRHEIDEDETARRATLLQDAVGDILPIDVDRGPAYRVWSADLSTDLGRLRGIENFMLDMYDNPAWLHRLLAFMRDGVLATHEQAEQAGDWGLTSQNNQAMCYARDLPDPAPEAGSVTRRSLWTYAAAQEFALVSPAMHEEFLLRYQLPLMAPFGLVAYGCCEDLSEKIDMLRQVPRLRRIAVAPSANVGRCAEQIGTDYVMSYRPSPADMVAYRWDASRVRRILERDFAAMRGCHFDITLKDVETVERDPGRVRNWVRVTRDVIDRMG